MEKGGRILRERKGIYDRMYNCLAGNTLQLAGSVVKFITSPMLALGTAYVPPRASWRHRSRGMLAGYPHLMQNYRVQLGWRPILTTVLRRSSSRAELAMAATDVVIYARRG